MLSDTKIVVIGKLNLEKVEKYLRKHLRVCLGTYLPESEKDKLVEQIKLEVPRHIKAFKEIKLVFWNGTEGELTLAPDHIVLQLCDPITVELKDNPPMQEAELEAGDFLFPPLEETPPSEDFVEALLTAPFLEDSPAEALARDLEKEKEQQALLARPISTLNLGLRCMKCMYCYEIETIGQLVQWSAEELSERKNFGAVSLNEVRKKLDALGLKLKGE